eukprot:gnl/MRDRNA2_/MRDRNA2_135740_c0_seq1.p1 gnl/MRDRNA2_/MRDRNA2_135740_c0~~gnl/MRDRNA2_/MRDRNA2_135740_c0_seq1.p1  ORF type:complete len:220 (+),score=15.72 gnl/MRDRNA2_/MRDRNA2_135740_c0_seq1:73-732(+)
MFSPRQQQYQPPMDLGNIIILGPPASGKGTQCDHLVQQYGLVHISTGDVLRARSRFLPEVKEMLDKGQLVPDNILFEVLRERLSEPDAMGRGVLFDGFPRTKRQAEQLSDLGLSISHVIHLDIPDEVVIERVEGRRTDPVSGRIYHVKYRPPTDQAVATRLIQRPDDTREKIKRRLEVYHKHSDDIIEYYQKELNFRLITVRFQELVRKNQDDVHGIRF